MRAVIAHFELNVVESKFLFPGLYDRHKRDNLNKASSVKLWTIFEMNTPKIMDKLSGKIYCKCELFHFSVIGIHL